MNKRNEPNSTFLNPCILASVYSCFSPNEPNFTLFLVLLPFPLYLFTFQLNEPNFKTPHLCNLRNLWFLFLQNKPNFPNFDLKMRISAENKPNFKVAQASVLESKFPSAPADSILLPFPLYLFTFVPNEPNFPRRACVESRHPVRPRGLKVSVGHNEPNLKGFNTNS
ncbi:MAG TPA: hypothetical protein PKB02_04155 [Anaerohalosphaeraceae bacterium]|nr:hypothetical protein [Anaerohalosphaeraceae bacterium]